MKVDSKELVEVLQRKVTQINEVLPRVGIQEVSRVMANKYNVKYANVNRIFTGKEPIEGLPDHMLYKLMKSIYDGLSDRWEELNLSELKEDMYFTEINIEQFSVPISYDTEDEDIVFTEWFQNGKDRYTTKATIDEIIKWRDLGKINYNPETQRDLTIKNSKGVAIKVVTLNRKAVKEMRQLMEANEFISDDAISLNLNTDINTETAQLIRVENGNLVIPKEAVIDIVDGYHRYWTMCLVKDKNPDWNFECNFNIISYSTEKAYKFMMQKDKKTHFAPAQVKRLDRNDEVLFLLDRLNESRNFNLKGKIINEVYDNLATIIENIFNPRKREDTNALRVFIEKNINELVEEKSLYNANLTKEEWFIYLYALNYCYNNNIEFIDIVKQLNINMLLDSISYKNEPLIKHHRLMDKTLKGMRKNG